MAVFEWKDNYSVGVKHIDEQHKKLIEMINNLLQAMIMGQGKSSIERIIESMADYTVSHFKTEEDLFDKYEYPETDTHKSKHEDFVKKVIEFKAKYEKGEQRLTVEVFEFLKDWLIQHIVGMDKNYGPFLNSKGIR
jgi:hemerythrin-like metal-binding protein